MSTGMGMGPELTEPVSGNEAERAERYIKHP